MMSIRFRPARSSLSRACLLCCLFYTGSASATQFQGTANGFGREQCFILDHFPDGSGALYHQRDTKKETELCGISFEDKGIALCPKTWSTSPGTIVYDIRESKYNGSPEAFESAFCPRQRALKDAVAGVDKLVARVVHNAGYNLLSFTRAFAVLNCQSALVCFLLRSASHASTSCFSTR